MSRRALLFYAAGLLAAALLPFVSKAARRRPGARCERDGVELGSLLRLRIESADGAWRSFCSVRCAEDWLQHSPGSALRVLVTDENGAEIDVRDAYWVVSSVVTSARTGEHLHAFARGEDARAHAATFHGMLLSSDARPFRAVP